MKGKSVLTVVLLLVVASSLAWLAVQEGRRVRAVKALKPPTAVVAEPSPASIVENPTPPEEAAPKVEAEPSKPPEAPIPVRPKVSRIPAPPPPEERKVVVYYLHTTYRCPSCYRIEEWTAAAVTGRFAPELDQGLLEWRVLNVDAPPNAHFIEDYQLFTKSVVVSEVKNGREVRWKRLDRVWDLLEDPKAFEAYIEREVRSFLEGP